MIYSEPSWLTEPPEDSSTPLAHCSNCQEQLYKGDIFYYSEYDSDRKYCSIECFDEVERKEKELQ